MGGWGICAAEGELSVAPRGGGTLSIYNQPDEILGLFLSFPLFHSFPCELDVRVFIFLMMKFEMRG